VNQVPSKKKFWQIKAQTDTAPAELLLYGPISGETWWGDEVTPQQFNDDLQSLGKVKELTVRINSEGGDVFAGQAILSMLKRHPASITVYVDGLAASIASVIAMAGDTVIMPRNAMMMVHNAWTFAYGNSNDFRKMADDLDKIGESLIAAYQDKTRLTPEEIKQIMDNETWLTADDCVKQGFADEIESSKEIAASLNGKMLTINGQQMDLSLFKNPPKFAATVESGKNPPKVLGAGRTLSAVNEGLITQARDLLNEVLDQLEEDPEDNPDDNAANQDETLEEEQTENGLLFSYQLQVKINQNRRLKS
jgi:ATP-dependent Clp protease protease subunit